MSQTSGGLQPFAQIQQFNQDTGNGPICCKIAGSSPGQVSASTAGYRVPTTDATDVATTNNDDDKMMKDNSDDNSNRNDDENMRMITAMITATGMTMTAIMITTIMITAMITVGSIMDSVEDTIRDSGINFSFD